MATAITQSATGNAFIDGLLGGWRWNGSFSYSFPDQTTDYQAGYTGELTSFSAISLQQREVVRAIMNGETALTTTPGVVKATYVNSFISFSVFEVGGLGNGYGSGGGDIRFGTSNLPSTAYAYYPNNNANGNGGDVWFGRAIDYTNPRAGNYAYYTMIHEIGHAMGLKHPHELAGPAGIALPAGKDSVEWTIMSYRDYVGDAIDGVSFGVGNAPQTFMMYDILALQTMYGAYYGASSNNTNTVYWWNPATGETYINGEGQGQPAANRVFLTIWDGGGTDTYNMANYATNVTINLAPGSSSITSEIQRADLEDGRQATGCVYNALLYQGDLRSIIENAQGGSGHDKIYGNQVANFLIGNRGNDIIAGGAANDILRGGLGRDVMAGGQGADDFDFNIISDSVATQSRDVIADFFRGTSITGDDIDLFHIDANTRVAGNQAFALIYGTAFHGRAGELRYQDIGAHLIVEGDVNGDRRADFQILVMNVNALSVGDFVL